LEERRGLLFESESEVSIESSLLMYPTCWRSLESQSSKSEAERSLELLRMLSRLL
jgi:hypothetical protein